MRICSVTMYPTGGGIRPATDTVADLVDEIIAVPYDGPIVNFADARNHALGVARDKGYDWAIMLDTDERISWDLGGNPSALRHLLRDVPFDVAMVRHVSGTYEKERIFRLPAKGHYHGRTHEAFLMDEGARRETITGFWFDEVAKTPEQYRAKVERDLPLLLEMVKEHPRDPRWWYYLGDTYSGLDEAPKAKLAFWECQLLDGWDEESAWANYRIAEIECAEHQFDRAISSCLSGMRRHPGMAELPWLAGWCCFQLGQWQRAIWWAAMAEALNKADADGERVGFRYPPALFEGPYDILRYCYRALGQDSLADLAEACFQERYDERISREKIAPS